MKKLGFFGGSFNPPTYAHINIAKMSIEKFNLDAVYFVPVGNLYNKPSLIDENYRYKMLELICNDKIKVESIELERKEPLNTLQAFELIEQKYKNTENYYIMGADNFEKLPTWKNAKELIENYKYIIFERNGSNSKSMIDAQELLKQNRDNFKFLSVEQYSNVSSGIIRKLIQNQNYEECEKYTRPEIVKYIKENNLKYFVMGNGSNLLISSKVFDGVVIKLNKLNNVQIYDNEVYVEAGYPLIKLCMLCADNNLGNLEFASGIPACVGGAICSNAGAYKMEMSDIVESVTVIDKDLNIVTLLKDDLKFAYRDSIFKEDKSYIIISAMLKLEYKDKSEILEIMESRKQRRLESQPLEYPSAGSVFRNPDAAPSGKLIEDAGLKGYTIGGAKVSEKHANFIINYNNATSEDIKKLIDFVRSKVKEKYNIELKSEQELINWE